MPGEVLSLGLGQMDPQRGGWQWGMSHEKPTQAPGPTLSRVPAWTVGGQPAWFCAPLRHGARLCFLPYSAVWGSPPSGHLCVPGGRSCAGPW
ncbi:unnamed protein product [Gulo gulo]|uniref:Uncharacterized protein n=1 Tax=Gulo gulo TaxID=48420 RepID=A0A9X9LLH2_GULGU|nr:unnamed protein product [Gulo gulo]